MNQLSSSQYLIIIICIVRIIFLSIPARGQLCDKEMAEKYGLKIPTFNDQIEPAPLWLQNADMVTSSAKVWKGYKFTLKDTLITRIVRHRAVYRSVKMTEHYPIETISSFEGSQIKGIPLIVSAPHSKKVFKEAHKQGFKAIPYLHFRCIHTNYSDQDVFYFEHPEILLKDSEGKWVNIPMDGSRRLHRFLTCANSPSYWKLTLDYVKKMLDWGADGFWIDNIEKREECYAAKFTNRNPEFSPYEHEHLFPDTTHNYAFDMLLQAIRTLVKSYGEDKIIVLNPGIDTDFQKNGDACMWESFIYSWAWEGRRHTWADVKNRAQKNKWFLDAGRKIIALSYLNKSRKEIKEDAFWAFSSARLVDFIWWAELNGTGAEILHNAHMGSPLETCKEMDGIAYRSFENGVIVLNDSQTDQDVELVLPVEFRDRLLQDIFTGSQAIQIKNRKIKVSVPKKSGRVYLSSLKKS